jgi:hypothetical protein
VYAVVYPHSSKIIIIRKKSGCPAVPVELQEKYVSMIKDKSCFFYLSSRVSNFGDKSIS